MDSSEVKTDYQNLTLSSIIIFSIILLDQLTKASVLRLGINHACNIGFAFGIYQGNLNGLIAFLVLLMVIYVFIRQARSDHQPSFSSSSGSEKNKPSSSSSESSQTRRVEKYSLVSSRLRSNNNFTMLALALVIGGGVSNIVDRLTRGCVIDFIQWPRQTWLPLPDWLQSSLTRWPAFNPADAVISVGVGILIFSLLKTFSK